MASFEDIVDIAKRLSDSSSPRQEREQALAQLNHWVRTNQISIDRDERILKAKGFAGHLLAEVPQLRQRLDAVPHLGALSPLSPARVSRLDYVALILEALLDLKEAYPSLGLGSNNHGLEYRGKHLSGLEVAQTLAIVTNIGHLFGTFATERALLFQLDDSPSKRRELAALVPPLLKDWADRILEERSFYRFFYVVAAIEIARLRCDPEVRNIVLQVFLRFEAVPTGMPMNSLTWALRKARQLAWLRLHSLMSLGVALEQQSYRSVFSYLRESEVFGFDPSAPTTNIETVLNAIDQLQSETVFTEPLAARLMLTHLRDFRTWWRAHERKKTPFTTILELLMAQPADWPTTERTPLIHYLRLRLPNEGVHWISEVRTWREDGNNWQAGTTFLLTPPPTRKGNVGFLVDLYTDGAITHLARYQIARVLAGKNRTTWAQPQSEASKMVWRAVALFVAKLLMDTLRDGYTVLLQPSAGRDGHSGYAIACDSLEPGCSTVYRVAAALHDAGRQQELEGVAELRRDLPLSPDCIWVAVLARVIIVEKASGQPAAEIDGLWVDITRSSCVWTAIEHKSGKGRGRVSQLDALSAFMAWPAGEIKLAKLSTGASIAWTTFVQPPSLQDVGVNRPTLSESPPSEQESQ